MASLSVVGIVGDSWVVVQFSPLMPPLEVAAVAAAWVGVQQACALAAAASPAITNEMNEINTYRPIEYRNLKRITEMSVKSSSAKCFSIVHFSWNATTLPGLTS